MPTTTTRRSSTKRKSPNQLVNWFSNWLGVKDEGAQLKERQEELRLRMLDEVKGNGVEDDKGNVFFDLPEPVTFEDYKGKVFKFATLKAERHLTPSQPIPDPELAEKLLRKLKLWIKPADEKVIRDLRIANPYVTITVDIDPDAVSQAYFKGIITDEQYDSILQEQTETFQFRPSES